MKFNKEYFRFLFDERLQVNRPYLLCDYEEMPEEVQDDFELRCQQVSAEIPEKIEALEREYMHLFDQLQETAEDDRFDQLMDQMNDLSSKIFDLNLLYVGIEGKYLGANVHG